ncbi:MAG: hypothetical protein M1816_004450 [Peltula sp. TS41687]|nr:MAG: hypothetical protein M1816_004450 [Peltula sp. TS41687]
MPTPFPPQRVPFSMATEPSYPEEADDDDPSPLRFASLLLPSPPNAAPATPFHLDAESATVLYSHAVLLFHAYSWHQSIKFHRTILRRDVGGLLPAAHLWFNIGIIRCHLGEYALGVEALDKAVAHDSDLAIAWFCMGIALFQLGDYRRAERRFKRCLACLYPGGPDVVLLIDYRPKGLDFALERTRVEFNIRLCLLWKLHKQLKADKPPPWSLNRLPAGRVFEPADGKIAAKENANRPVEAITQQEREAERPLPPLPKSHSLKNAPKRVLTALRRRPRTENANTQQTPKTSKGKGKGKGKGKTKSAPANEPSTTSGVVLKPSMSPALYIPTYVGPPSPSPPTADGIGRHQRNDSFAIMAPAMGDGGCFKPLPPLPPPPIGSNTPPARRSFVAARRHSALAMLTAGERERAYSSSAPAGLGIVGLGGGPGPSVRRSRRSPLAETETAEDREDARDSFAIFAMGVLKKAQEDKGKYDD